MAAAEGDRLGSMFTFFLIALLLVSPFGFRVYRRTMRERRAALGLGPVGGDEPDAPPVDPADLAGVVDTITRSGRDLRAGEDRIVVVPDAATVDGRPAPASLVDKLIADATRRSGLDATWLEPGADGRRLRVVRAASD